MTGTKRSRDERGSLTVPRLFEASRAFAVLVVAREDLYVVSSLLQRQCGIDNESLGTTCTMGGRSQWSEERGGCVGGRTDRGRDRDG